MTRFFQRGGAWVIGQSVLLGALGLLAVLCRGGGYRPASVIAGASMLCLGAGIALAGVVALGKNLTPFPKPSEEVQLVRHGIYGLMRHPLYTSVMVLALGWALVWQSWPALLVVAVLPPFFAAKARREERWLRQKFPDYAAYAQQVRRFIPWVY